MTPDGAFVVGREVRPTTKPTSCASPWVEAAAPVPRTHWSTPASTSGTPTSPQTAGSLPTSRTSRGGWKCTCKPYPRLADGRWQVSLSGGSQPHWTRGGRELIYIDDGGRISSVAFETNRADGHRRPPRHAVHHRYADAEDNAFPQLRRVSRRPAVPDDHGCGRRGFVAGARRRAELGGGVDPTPSREMTATGRSDARASSTGAGP